LEEAMNMMLRGFLQGLLSRVLRAISALALIILMLTGIVPADRGVRSAPLRSPRQGRTWSDVHNWVYWLDRPNLERIGGTSFNLAVIDYSYDGTEAGEFSLEEISTPKQATCARKVVSYLSIGEAEDYRWYWQPEWRPGHPEWIVEENPDWPGNYRVRYWDPEWQAIVFAYLDRILAAGFDGVYLDIVEAYQLPYAWGHRQDMVDFVVNIANYGRAHSSEGQDFGVFPQNGEELGALHPEYLAVLNGIGKEETYYYAMGRPVPWRDRLYTEALLDNFKQAGYSGLVLTVDYTLRRRQVNLAYHRAAAKGYVEYCTHVNLDRMIIYPGHEPVCDVPR